METNDNKYKHGNIYRITDISYTKFYYGSTVQSLAMRMGGHRREYFKFKEGRHQKFISAYSIFDEFGFENCKIELVELHPCNTREELHKREGYYIQTTVCVNKIIAGRTPVEYRKTDKNKIIQKNWRDNNKDYMKHYYEEHREIRKEACKSYYQANLPKLLDYQKEYKEEHKERIKERDRIYYEQNKQRILERGAQKVICSICGGTYTYQHTSRHEQSQKHQKALNQEPKPEK